MKLNETQLKQVDAQVKRLVQTDSYYGNLYKEHGITEIKDENDSRFEKCLSSWNSGST